MDEGGEVPDWQVAERTFFYGSGMKTGMGIGALAVILGIVVAVWVLSSFHIPLTI